MLGIYGLCPYAPLYEAEAVLATDVHSHIRVVDVCVRLRDSEERRVIANLRASALGRLLHAEEAMSRYTRGFEQEVRMAATVGVKAEPAQPTRGLPDGKRRRTSTTTTTATTSTT